ncbi:IclR family transcriptional regulator [Rhodococcus sp. IEGM 1379]|uniref:IclR family transcriptional regulator n=1 Tax=Rhodococcus sp. IEGM 1379 TaxID=3047086 RepID=UPI0024B72684|nr:IclR family transcriptional regulator [Rhodococcus sp. IEGM 1379]MDI9917674.1 IclR family transcriptional regulator [Rhodococcus sp. IEGM 1379]
MSDNPPTEPLPSEQETKAFPVIQAVERAAIMLAAFTPQRPRITLGEITAALGTSKATAHRYTKALRDVNLIRFDAGEVLYSLGPQILTLAAAARAGLPVIKSAEVHMEQLLREVRETVVLSVWDGESPIVVATNDNTDQVARVTVRVGARLSPTASAQGRVFCAFLPPEDVPMLRTEIHSNLEFADELERIRATLVSVKSPVVNGLRTLSAPVFAGGRVVAALAVVAASVSVSGDIDRHIAALKRTAENLSRDLGQG